MPESRRWTVATRVSYSVDADSPDEALGAVLPLLSLGKDRYGPQPASAEYTIREERPPDKTPVAEAAESMQGLTKPIYTAKEAAQILGISVNAVYERVPSLRIGSSRRYSRSTLLDIIEHGIAPKEEPVRVTYHNKRRSSGKAPAIVRESTRSQEAPSSFITLKEAAQKLHISVAALKQLLQQKRIFHSNQYGRLTIPRDAFEFYLKGLAPRAFVEERIAYFKQSSTWGGDTEELQKVADEWRKEWPE